MSAKLQLPNKRPSKDNLREILSYNICVFRVNKEWSQEQLAFEAGLDRTYISAIERTRRNPTLANLEKIAAKLDVEVWELLKFPDKVKK